MRKPERSFSMAVEKTGKKLLNSVERCVEDNLEGYVALNPGVRLLQGQPRVLVRADFEELQKTGKVAVVCGGGSGHEPAFSGYVGRGMLAAAAMGSVFASPSPSIMLAAIRAVTYNNPAGCLLLIPNYTGDRLNFGPAAERAQREGMRVSTVTVGEDCALTSRDKSAGRRGLTGIPVCIKIAGALAEEGRSLEEIIQVVSRALGNMATIGVALTPCFVPGSGPTFTLPPDEMELGLGVQEAGVRRLKVMTAKETVAIMLDHMTSTENVNRLSLEKGQRVAVFINDLGGISHMELNIIVRETIAYLETRGIQVVRALCSPFVSSLEMAGTHVTVLRLDDDVTRCLDAPTAAPHWPRPVLCVGVADRFTPDPIQLDYVHADTSTHFEKGVTLTIGKGEELHGMVWSACQALVKAEQDINTLDSQAGDGDCGSTLARGARRILEELGPADNPGLTVCRPALLAYRLAEIAETVMGGASGGVYSLFFTGISAALGDEEVPDIWPGALRKGIEMIERYSGAEPGDRTMLDALQPALDSLTTTVDCPPSHRFQQAVKAAQEGMEATRTMKARAGRASYVRASLLQHPDAGAMGVATWLSAACQAFTAADSGTAV